MGVDGYRGTQRYAGTQTRDKRDIYDRAGTCMMVNDQGNFLKMRDTRGIVCEGHGQVQMVTDGYVWVQMSVLGRGNTKTRQEGSRIGADGGIGRGTQDKRKSLQEQVGAQHAQRRTEGNEGN